MKIKIARSSMRWLRNTLVWISSPWHRTEDERVIIVIQPQRTTTKNKENVSPLPKKATVQTQRRHEIGLNNYTERLTCAFRENSRLLVERRQLNRLSLRDVHFCLTLFPFQNHAKRG